MPDRHANDWNMIQLTTAMFHLHVNYAGTRKARLQFKAEECCSNLKCQRYLVRPAVSNF